MAFRVVFKPIDENTVRWLAGDSVRYNTHGLDVQTQIATALGIIDGQPMRAVVDALVTQINLSMAAFTIEMDDHHLESVPLDILERTATQLLEVYQRRLTAESGKAR